jgi:hypothetical protein
MPPNSALGEALGYATRQRAKLVFFLDHAEVPIHNSFVKRQIEQYALGQKLWMFCYDKAWRQASADLSPLVMTARADGSGPSRDAIEALLPWNFKIVTDARLNG